MRLTQKRTKLDDDNGAAEATVTHKRKTFPHCYSMELIGHKRHVTMNENGFAIIEVCSPFVSIDIFDSIPAKVF